MTKFEQRANAISESINSKIQEIKLIASGHGNLEKFIRLIYFHCEGRHLSHAKPGSQKKGRGFTLIELMLMAAIIGLLVAIAIPKFANLIQKAKEAVLKGQVGAIRSALTI